MDNFSSPDRPRRIVIIYNPTSGRWRQSRFARILVALKKTGCEITAWETRCAGHAIHLARMAADGAFDIIVAAGGDGTINEVVNGLSGSTCVLGIIPLGTANVFAREIVQSFSPDAIAHTLAFGPIKEIMIGRANDRLFIMMAGVGFDANIVAGVSIDVKKKIGPFAYVIQAFREASSGRTMRCRVQIDTVDYLASSVIVCNGRHYGGPFIAAPGARLTNQDFQILLFKGQGSFSLLRYGLALIFNRLGACADVEIVSGKHIVVFGSTDQPAQVDGELLRGLPLHICKDQRAMKIVYPR